MKHHYRPGFVATGLIWLLAVLLALPPGLMYGQLAVMPPKVLSHQVNDGNSQRSTVTNLSLTFTTNLTLVSSNLVLRNLTTSNTLSAGNLALHYDSNANLATWTFPGLPGGSLPEGNYMASLLANTVSDSAGNRLDGSGNNHPGTPYSFDLFRRFGDSDGDRDVDFFDTYRFQQAFSGVNPALNPVFDFNGDGLVNSNDLYAFQSNYLTLFPAQPGIFAALVKDTGASPWDNITSDPTIAGTVVKTNLVYAFQAAFDQPAGPFLNVSTDLNASGSFWFSSNRLAAINAGALGEGAHNLFLRTLDAQSNVSAAFSLSFILDTTPPALSLALDPRDDSPPVGDLATVDAIVRLIGQTEPNVEVTLTNLSAGTGPWWAVADSAGAFIFTNIALNPGTNLFRADTMDLAGNSTSATLPITLLGSCGFTNLNGWTIVISDPSPLLSNSVPGSVVCDGCDAVMTEGDSFRVSMEYPFAVPTNAGSLFLTFAMPAFDPSSTNLVKDAFEAALVDATGRPLTFTVQGATGLAAAGSATPQILPASPDAFFNMSEGNSPVTAPGVTLSPSVLDPQILNLALDISMLPPGSFAKLILRLVNNDLDRRTMVHIKRFALGPGSPGLNLIGSSPPAFSLVGPAAAPGCDPGKPNFSATSILAQKTVSGSPSNTNSSGAITPGGPTVTIQTPFDGAVVTAGSYVLSGYATPDLSQPTNRIVRVTVNGANADAVDAAGNFFSAIEIHVGVNSLQVVAVDAFDQATTNTVTVSGTACSQNFASLGVVSGALLPQYGRTSFNEWTRVLYADLALQNSGSYSIGGPCFVGISQISDPTVRLLAPDGVSADGIPYYDFSAALSASALDPQHSTLARTLAFHNPNRVQFTYQVAVVGQLNRVPFFTTIPSMEALSGIPYTYHFGATDADGDSLSYSVVSGPTNLLLNPALLTLSFQPAPDQVGMHDVRLRACDGHGGTAEQHYLLSVIDPPPNRPPYFTSTPNTLARLGTNYTYTATALDPDGDVLTYALAVAPPNVSIDPTTGRIQWTPTADSLGDHDVTIQVADGRGGVATQAYSVAVLPDAADHAPILISQPVTNITAGQLYTYAAHALDPDNDVLTYRLGTAPPGASITSSNGLIQWMTSNGDIGFHPFTLQVDDGRGGSDRQSFQVEVMSPADLVIGQIDKSQLVYDGQALTVGGVVACVISNLGPGQVTQPFDVLFFEDRNLNGAYDPGSDGMLGTATVTNALATGQAQTLTAQLSGYVLFPDNIVWGFVDSSNQVAEVNEGNNLAHSINCQTTPDLVAADLRSTQTNGAVVLTARAGNGGELDVAPGVNVTFYQGNPTLGGTPLGVSHTLGGIPAGGFEDVSLTLNTTCLPAPPGLVGWWPGEGNTADIIGGIHATPYGGVSIGAGKVGRGFAFDGGTNSYLLVPESPSQEPGTGSFTIEAWFRPTKPLGYIVSKYAEGGLGSGGPDDIELFLGTTSTGFGITLQIRDLEDRFQTISATNLPPSILDGRYHHIAAGRDQENQTIFLYVDGVPYSAPLFATGAIFGDGQSAPWLIGNSDWCCGQPIGSQDSPFAGTIDEVSFYNRALSVVEIQAIYQADAAGKCPPSANLNLIANGSFEVPILASNTYYNILVPPWPSWQVTGGAPGAVNGISNYGFGDWPLPEDGQQYAVFGAESDSFRDALSQTVIIPVQGTYLLSWFDISPHYPNGVLTAPYSVTLLDSKGQVLVTNAFDAYHTALEHWVSNSLSLALSPGSYTVTFEYQGIPMEQNLLLDNVSLRLVDPVGPLIAANPELSVVVLPGTNAMLSASAAGSAPLSFQWQFNGTNLTDNSRITGSTSNLLTIRNVSSSDVGYYDVVVTNSYGSTTSAVAILMLPRNLIVNGSFEDGSFLNTLDNYDQLPLNSTDLTGWKVIQNSVSWGIKPLDGFAASDGVAFVDLTGIGTEYPYGGLSQTLTTMAGQRYLFAIDVSTDSGGVTVTVAVDGSPLQLAPGPSFIRGGTVWTTETGSFTASGSQTELNVMGAGDPGSYILFADNVYITTLTTNIAPGDIWVSVDDDGTGRAGVAECNKRNNILAPSHAPVPPVTVPTNQPPVFLSTPPTNATVGQVYRYSAAAVDLDGDALTFSLAVQPSGMLVDPPSGIIVWNPAKSQLGANNVVLRVYDSRGGVAVQSFQVVVVNPDIPPVITSEPVTNAVVNLSYRYQVTAQDAENTPLAFSLLAGPAGMTIDASSGLATWNPSPAQVGVQQVTVSASDNSGGSASQSFTILVAALASNSPPVIFSQPVTSAVQGQLYQYAVVAVDPDDDPLVFSLTQAPNGMSINPTNGLVQWRVDTNAFASNGVTVQVSDGRGGFDQQTFALVVNPPCDLTLGAIDTSGLVYDGQSLTVGGNVSCVISNLGPGLVPGPFNVLFFEDRNLNGVYDEGIDAVLGSAAVTNNLGPAQSQSLTTQISGNVLFTGNLVWGYVDSSNVIFETNKGNNVASSDPDCRRAPIIGQFNPIVKWHKTAFDVEPGYDQVMMAPVVADLNRDGTPDVVFSTFHGNYYYADGVLRAIRGSDGSELWTVTNAAYRVLPGAAVALGDIDGDGFVEVAAVHESGGIIVFNHDGTFRWLSSPVWALSKFFYGAPALADLDHDGKAEVIVGGTVVNYDGTIRWQGNQQGGTGTGLGFPLVADLDLDGSPEVIAGNSAYHADGSLYWNANASDGFTALADFDGDGYPEIVLVTEAGELYLLDHTGAIKWGPISNPGGYGGPPTIADMDGDGRLEIGVAGANHYVVFKDDGSVLWSQPTQDFSSAVTGSSVFDFVGDGKADVVYGDEQILRIYRGSDGNVLFSIHKSSGTLTELPVIVDVDGDGTADIVAAANNYYTGPETGIYVYGDSNNTWVATRQIWNQHTYHINNVNDDGSIPRNEVNSWQSHNTYRLNLRTASGGPLAAPDLVSCFLGIQSVVVAGQTQSVASARIGNRGSLPASPGINITFYNGNPALGGSVLGTTNTTRAMVPGSYEDVGVVCPLTTAINDLWVSADDDGNGNGLLLECNKTNNLYHIGTPAANMASISGTVFIDVNTNGILDSAGGTPEPGLPNRVVYFDQNQNGRRDLGEIYTASAADGTYLFTNVAPGKYFLAQELPGGWFQTAPSNGFYTLVVTNGEVLQGLNFGSTLGTNVLLSPFFISTPATNATMLQAYRYDALAVDPRGATLTYSLPAHPAGMGINPGSGSIIWTPQLNQAGASSVLVQASNSFGSIATQVFSIEVAGTNFPPTIASSPSEVIRLGFTYSYQILASDPNGDTLSYSLPAGPSGMTVSPTGLVTWTPASTQFGSNYVSLQVDDGQGGKATQSYAIQVVASTQTAPPSITSKPVLTATVGQLYSYNATAFEQNSASFGWSLDVAPIGMSISPTLGTIRWTPTADQLGTNQVVVRVVDGLGGFATQSFLITVRAASLPPTITSIPPTVATVSNLYAYAVRASDPQNGPLSIALQLGPTNMTLNITNGLIEWTPTMDQLGSNQVQFVVQNAYGRTASQNYTVVVTTNQVNVPVINSTPLTVGHVGNPYQYQVVAADPAGNSLTYRLLNAPLGMTISAGNGLVSWTPSLSQTGQQSVAVAAVNSLGSLSRQDYTISVAAINHPPTITSVPPNHLTAGTVFRYDVVATDPDGDPLAYFVNGPAGTTIDNFGQLIWPSSVTNSGLINFTVTVADAYGAAFSQFFQIPVVADSQGPVIGLACPSQPLSVGNTLVIQLFATDNSGPASITATLNGLGLPLDNNLSAQVTLTQPGQNVIAVTGTDIAGNTTQTNCAFLVNGSGGPGSPVAQILSPADGSRITQSTDIVGTASSTNLQLYTLVMTPVGGGATTQLAQGTMPITNGVLGRLDTTLLRNDSYLLRLTVTDNLGRSSVAESTVGVAGELKLGNFRLSFTDLTVPVSGIPITIARTYDTLNSDTSGDFGYGWRLEFAETQLRSSVPPPSAPLDSPIVAYNPFVPGTRIYCTLPGGQRQAFTFTPIGRLNLFGTVLYTAGFTPDPGVTSSLRVGVLGRESDPNAYFLTQDQTTGGFVDFGSGLPFNPADPYLQFDYTLSTKEGVQFAIDAQESRLKTLTDPNGNTLTFTSQGILSSTGLQVLFERDPQGRITAVIDPAGHRISYAYNSAGDLLSVTDRMTNKTQFVYHPVRAHYLQQVIDPLGRVGVRSEYDDAGHLVQLLDAGSNAVHLVYDPNNSVEQVVDVLGNTNTYVYDDRGNIVTEVNALGAVTQRTFDANNFMTAEIDAIGHTNFYEYDSSGNVTKQTDPLGHVKLTTYAPNSRIASITDPLGNTTVNQYDSSANLTATIDAAGNVSHYAYDRAGNLTLSTDAAGNTTGFAYDGAGHLLQQTDALGHSTTYAYDANGNRVSQSAVVTVALGAQRTNVTTTVFDSNNRPISVTDAAGNTARTEYDSVGKAAATVDALGHRTEFRYDDRGRLTNTLYADGTSSSATYDAAGHRTSSTDRAGRTTYFQHDPVGQLVATIYPDDTPADVSDNPRTGTEYDLVGHVSARIDERTNRTSFAYDAVGRQVAVTNALGAVTTTIHDNAGRVVASADGLGHITQFVYDALGHRMRTLFADGTQKQAVYDALGRSIAEIDQLGVTNQFHYDALGRLTNVLDALGHNAFYAYDEAGNLVVQQDANQHITRYEYDGLGRRVATILPLGQRSDTGYDPIGNVSAATNFNRDVIAYQYDANNRLTNKYVFNGRHALLYQVTYSYTPAGRRQTITDSRGLTVFSYDARDRLLSRIDPDGRSIRYVYDVTGNRTSIITPSGTNSYTFDAVNRLETVVDPDGGVARYAYDLGNNVVSMALPNGGFRTNAYDSLNRVTNIVHSGPTGVFASFNYTLAPTGNRVSVVEHTGRTVSYAYDALSRLTQETVSNDPSGQNFVGSYVYDPGGNRVFFTNTLEGLSAYSYDANDELLAETLTSPSGSLTTVYGYDSNGNTLFRSNAFVRATYGWTPENHLITANLEGTNGAHLIAYQYNDDGIRSSGMVDGLETRYLIDENHPYAQVIEEYSSSGTAGATYCRGFEEIVSQFSSGRRLWYHTDHLGNTRILTDGAGVGVEEHWFDAYGQMLRSSGAGASTRFLFAGGQKDDLLDIYYLNARYLRVNNGRFLTQDPYPANPKNGSSLNRFGYVLGNPVNDKDPTGLQGVLTLAGLGVALSIESIALVGSSLFLGLQRVATKSLDNAEINDFVQDHQLIGASAEDLIDLEESLSRRNRRKITLFFHYSFVNQRNRLLLGLLPGSFVTRTGYETGWRAKWYLALYTNPQVQDAEYIVDPEPPSEATYVGLADPKYDIFRQILLGGGGDEWQFFLGSGGAGTVFGPIELPIGLAPPGPGIPPPELPFY